MRDPRLNALADVLVRYSTRVKRGDLVGITGDPSALPLVAAVYEAVIGAGGHPFYKARPEELADILLERGNEEQLKYFSKLEMAYVETVDLHISLWAEVNTRSASGVDPKRQAMAASARRPFMQEFMRRTAAGELRWVGTLFPTQAAAQDAEMSLRQYENFVFGAGHLSEADPVGAWRAIHARQERIREHLQKCKVVRFRAASASGHDGTDLTVDVSGGTWINCAGTENFPDGEVFCGPQGADGHVNYTFPAVYQGREVEGVRLAFKGGRVVDASATKNEAYLIEMLDQDAGARNMGEIAIGTNYSIERFSRNTLFDEKIGGTFHAAVGAGYPESGNHNESALHWDMVCELRPDTEKKISGGTIEADGEVIHKDGRFVGPLAMFHG